MKKHFIPLITLVVLIVVTVLMILPERSDRTIKVGVIATLTGVGAYQGQQELRGLELARDEINSNGGVDGKQIEFIVEDSKADPKEAVRVFQKLISIDNVTFIIGDSWSSTTVALVPLANENNVILISPLALLNELSRDDYFFRTIPAVQSMMEPLARHAYESLKSRRVGILRQQTPFGVEHAQYFKAVFEKLGGVVVGEESFPLSQTDVRTEITKLKSSNPDTILNLHGTGPILGNLMKQAKELGVEAQWISSFGAQNIPLVNEFSETIDGLAYPYPYDGDSDMESVKTFNERYQKQFNELPDMTAANSYDALMVLTKTIENTGENPTNVKNGLLSVKNYSGASGEFSFDPNGDVKKPIIIKQIQSGKFVKVSD